MGNNKRNINEIAKQQQNKFEDWEESPEGIQYRLSIIPNTMDYDEGIVINVLSKLPKDVRDKVLDEVVFLGAYQVGQVITLHLQKVFRKEDIKESSHLYYASNDIPVILLDLFELDKIISSDDSLFADISKEDVVAHEIAHFILGHHTENMYGKSAKIEKEADDLSEEWGFKRAYKSYEHFEKFDHTV